MPFRTFESSVYIRRRRILKEKMADSLILLLGNEEVGMNYGDNWYPFRQDSHLLYYFGLPVAGLAALIDAENGTEILFGKDWNIDDIVWTGPMPTLADMAAAIGVHQTMSSHRLPGILADALRKGRKIHFLPPYRHENGFRLASWLEMSLLEVNQAASLPLIKAIVSQRAYKEDVEIAEMDQAAAISADMHLAAMQYARPGMKEYEIAAQVVAAAHSRQASLSFQPIVTVRGETLHNTYQGNTLREGQMVLCDAGAANDMHYAGDLTCTFPVGRQFTSRQRDIYDIVLEAQEAAVAALRPGVLYRDIYYLAARKMTEGLCSLGLMQGDPAEAVALGAHGIFFQCGLGHMIGLDVHDMEDLGEMHVGYADDQPRSTLFGEKSLRLARALEPGFTLTIEPGVYMIPSLMDKWRAEQKFADFIRYDAFDAYRDFGGIRIEEDYLITSDGSRLLGKRLPKTAAEVESVRAG